VVLNEGDPVILEEPGYLGAIQALSLYRPNYLPIEVSDHGMDVEKLALLIEKNTPKLMYTVPNFQNPSGITYSGENRNNIAEHVAGKPLLLVEDDPYGALRFAGTKEKSFYHLIPEQTLLLGSFSKVVVPGFRLGWVVAPEHMYEKLLIAKQASDLHTCNFTQFILQRYLIDNDLDEHIKNICRAYGRQCQAMLDSIDEFFPSEISSTRPEGGMFLWSRLPDEVKSMSLFEQAVAKQVVFVPGEPFYTTARRTSTFRLNFSCVDEHHIRKGIKRLSQALMGLLQMQ
jgi:2-aminoadipate transaminase